MKKIVLFAAMFCLCGIAMAQNVRYKGMVDYGSSYAPIEHATYGTLTTTHGVGIADRYYVGIGVGFQGVFRPHNVGAADYAGLLAFAAFKYDILLNDRIGLTAQVAGGAANFALPYAEAAFGLRFPSAGRQALNLLLFADYVGAQRHSSDAETYEYFYICPSSFGLRLSLEL